MRPGVHFSDTLFYAISSSDFLEASIIMDHPTKSRNLHIISKTPSGENIVGLGLVNDSELNQLVKILNLSFEPRFKHLDDVRRYFNSYY